MSLLDEATMMSALTPERLTVAWMALTVRPLSGVLKGICSLSTRATPSTVRWVFGVRYNCGIG
jgi:hypothetical protein